VRGAKPAKIVNLIGPGRAASRPLRIRPRSSILAPRRMAHAKLDNTTPFAVAPTYAMDEDGRPLLVPLVQATYEILAGRSLDLAPVQEPPSLAGELWGEDIATSCYRIEPAFAFTKPATDVVLVGHAQSPRHAVAELQVTFRVGPVGRVLRVTGDRVWVHSLGSTAPTRPLPFDRMPLSYERAFGGWDRSSPDPARHTFEARNPIGVGFRGPNSEFEEGVALPNLEDPESPIEAYGQVIAPAGVGFLAPHWQPRASFAGTYDEAWSRTRMPLLPRDFDRRFFNAASPGLVAPGYLRGNEAVLVDGASPLGRLSFNLPGTPPPRCLVALRHGPDVEVALALDTLVVDTDRDRVLVLYRGYTPLRDGPHDVRAILIGAGGEGSALPSTDRLKAPRSWAE
jgi:hypothetical protein